MLRKARGVSLLETMLVLAIFAGMSIAAFSLYKQYEFIAHENQFEDTISHLQKALLNYFVSGCGGGFASSFSFSPSMQTFQDSGLVSSAELNTLVNPWNSVAPAIASSFHFSIVPALPQTNTVYHLLLTADMPDASEVLLLSLQHRFAATQVDTANKTLTWEYAPNQDNNIGKRPSEFWGLKSSLSTFQQTQRELTMPPAALNGNLCWPRENTTGVV